MEEVFIVVIALAAAYFLYRKMFKSNGCNCGNSSENGSCKVNEKK